MFSHIFALDTSLDATLNSHLDLCWGHKLGWGQLNSVGANLILHPPLVPQKGVTEGGFL